MSVGEFPVVQVWRPSREGTWEQRATIDNYESLDFTAEWLKPGSLSLTMEPDDQAFRILRRSAITVDYRGWRGTYFVGTRDDTQDQRHIQNFEVAGIGALAILSGVTAWPSPENGPDNQGNRRTYAGPAETVIRKMVAQNLRDRLGYPIIVPTSQGRGRNVNARCRYANVFERCEKKARAAGLTLDIGLVSTGTRGHMTLLQGVTRDKTNEVRLSLDTGTLTQWRQRDKAPEATRVIVLGQGKGADRQVVVVGPVGDIEWQWNFPREVVQDRRDTDDVDDLTEAGQETLAEKSQTRALTMTAAELADGLQAFTHYLPGDKVTGQILKEGPEDELEKGSATEIVTGISVSADVEKGVSVTPTIGAPRHEDPLLYLAQLVRIQHQHISALETAQ